MKRFLCAALIAFTAADWYPCLAQSSSVPEHRVDSNVVFGMYSGLALLMDVHHPSKPNGRGVILIAGRGWNAWLNYGAPQLKNDAQQVTVFLPPLLDAGFTVFSINHRSTPRFSYPAPLEDAQRAVRFIRHSAKMFGIDPDHIGAVGISTGAHLVNLLGVLDPKGLADSMDAINHVSASIQCVVAFSAVTDFTSLPPGIAWQNVALLTGVLGDRKRGFQKGSDEYHMLESASPLHHVSAASAPTLLVQGEEDEAFPFEQAQIMETALRKAGVPVRLLRVPGGKHTFFQLPAENRKGMPDFFGEMNRWLNNYLR